MSETVAERPEEQLDRAIDAVVRDELDDAAVAAAAARAWDRLARASETEVGTGGALHTCDDFRTLMPAFAQGSLAPAKALLVDDHIRSCVSCRREHDAIRRGGRQLPQSVPIHESTLERLAQRVPLRALAAVLVGAIGLAGGVLLVKSMAPRPVLARAESVEGALFRITAAGSSPLAPDAAIRVGEPIRTSRDADAVLRLADGSLVEMAARSEVSLAESGGATTIHLDRGTIIVSAVDQGAGRLDVVTEDCRVSVVGTIFTVRRGAKGSRISVIEGQVVVTEGGEETVLGPGEQMTTDPRLGQVPIAEEIEWSRDVDDYIKLLAELRSLGNDLQALPQPATRRESALLAGVPADTVVYAALPNISATLADANRLIEEHLSKSEVLRDWWTSPRVEGPYGPAVTELLERMGRLGGYLGDEIVVAGWLDEDGEIGAPVVLAQVEDPASFRQALEEELRSVMADVEGTAAERGQEEGSAGTQAERGRDQDAAVTGPERGQDEDLPVDFLIATDAGTLAELAASEPSGRHGAHVWMGGGIMVAGPSVARIADVVVALQDGGTPAFNATPFGQQILASYDEGVTWLVAADLGTIVPERIARDGAVVQDHPVANSLANVENLIFSQRPVGDATDHRVALTFDGARQGLAAWLAAPASMGALDFVSADAYLAAALVVDDPSIVVRDVLQAAGEVGDGSERDMDGLAAADDVALIEDLAGGLGGELAVAIDGPVLPKPAWKVIVEVYDAGRVQQALEALVERMSAQREEAKRPGVELRATRGGEGAAYAIRPTDGSPALLYYTIADGYLIAAPEAATVDQAVQVARLGTNLPRSEGFAAHLPRDGRSDLSAVLYQNIGPVLAPLVGQWARSSSRLTDEQRAALQTVGEGFSSTLVYAYAESDRIIVGTTSGGGPLGIGIEDLVSLGGLLTVQDVLSGLGVE